MTNPDDLMNLSVRDFAAAAAAKTPTPGGGSVAGAVGALAVALGEMALNFTVGKKKYAEFVEVHAHLGKRLENARAMFMDLVADDIAAYGMYQESNKMDDGPEKEKAQALALAAATNVPREMAKLTMAVLGDLEELSDKCNKFLYSDLLASAALGCAVLRLCDYNVRINTPYLADRQAAEDIAAASKADLAEGQAILARLEAAWDK